MGSGIRLQLIRKHLTPLMGSLSGVDYYFYGGCLRDLYQGKLPNDYDMGCSTPEDLQKLVDKLLGLGWILELESSFGLKFKYLNNIVDVSTDSICSPPNRISKFDFTINALAYTSDNICMFHNTSFKDINERKISPLKDYKHGNEVIIDRAIKFWKSGYYSKGNKLPPPIDFSLSSMYVGEVDFGVFDVRN